jgi:valyl-tRNA synthetase
MVSEQWFLRMSEMAQAAIAASEAGRIHWHPQRYERTYLDWLRGLKDWCVSRQLWLGHRIPVFTCPDGHVFASADFPDACRECGKGPLSQDPDVLDTWFSSALWPFATLGWPDDTPALRAFYPTDMNCTAREIINLWVSRMIMTGLEFRGEIPFSHVAIHCVVQTVDGKRMSKSKGTGIDPREMVAKYGADALRAWSASIAMSSQDVRFDESRIDGFRRFSNKLWNATRLVLGGVEGPCPMLGTVNALEDRWILSELQETVRIVTDGIEEFHFHSSVGRLYSFAWNQFCDWYLEAAKPRLRAADPAAQATALIVLDTLMRLLHPFMPFVTEEIWHRLPGERGYLDQAQWPAVDPIHDRPEARSEFAEVISAVEEIRAARQAAGAPPKGGQLMVTGLSEAQLALLQALAGVQILPKLDGPGTPLSHVNGTIVFPSAARGSAARNQAELGKLNAELARIEAKLSNPEFVAKAPEAVVDKERAKLAEVRESIERLS